MESSVSLHISPKRLAWLNFAIIFMLVQASPWTGIHGMPTSWWFPNGTSSFHSDERATTQELTCVQPPANLVSWWSGQNNAEDMLGNNNGLLMNGATFAQGLVEQAFSLDGNDDYVSVPDQPGLNPTSSITVALWAKRSSLNYGGLAVKKGFDDSSGYSLESDSNNVAFWIYITGHGWVSSPLSTLLLVDQWVHLVGVYDGSAIRLYINGSSSGIPTPVTGDIVTASSPLAIGSDLANYGRNFGGLIDEVQVFNRALSSSEIMAMYSSGSAGQCGIYTHKEVDKPLAPSGSRLNFTITLDNKSSANFQTVALTDTLPVTLGFIDGSLSATSGTASRNGQTISWSGSVNSGQMINITYGTRLSQSAVIGSQIFNSALLNYGSGDIIRKAQVTVSKHYYYLPMINTPPTGLTGRVTLNGVPAAGIALDLRFYNGSSWSTKASTVTTADGGYSFMNVPALTAGQSYYVRYINTNDPSRVYTWHSGVKTTYSGAKTEPFEAFDIANIELLKPDPGVTVDLPATFTWAKRPATPTDNYEFELFDFADGDPFFSTALGYVNSYVLPNRPVGFLNGEYYGWDVAANSPDGGFGKSYWYYYVKLNSPVGDLTKLEAMSGPRQPDASWEAPGIPADR